MSVNELTAPTRMVPGRSRWTAVVLMALAVMPYLALKLLWLTGSTLGLNDADGVAEMHDTRMVIGNNVTIALELVAVAFAVVLVHPGGRRVPAWMMLAIGAGAAGLLAPILLGLPLGSVLQLIIDGGLHTEGMDHMQGWVFAIVYGGFAAQAIVLAVLGWRYTRARWGSWLAEAPKAPSRSAILIGAIGLLPFGAAMLWWGVAGPGTVGPQSMDAIVQRSTLVVSGLLAIGGFVAPLITSSSPRWPLAAWPIAVVGWCTATLQAPTQILLAHQGNPAPAIVALVVITVPGAVAYGLLTVRSVRRQPAGANSAAT